MTTRADAEAELIARLGTWMTAAGLDGTTVDGTNASLDSAFNYALRDADESAIADLDSTALDRFYDLTELRALVNTLQNYKKVDVAAGPSAKLDQLGQRMERRLAQLRAFVAFTYGIGGGGAFSVTPTRVDGYSDLAALDA